MATAAEDKRMPTGHAPGCDCRRCNEMRGGTEPGDICTDCALIGLPGALCVLHAAAWDLLAALRLVMWKGHYTECLAGKRGLPPDTTPDTKDCPGTDCSNVCVALQKALVAAEGRRDGGR